MLKVWVNFDICYYVSNQKTTIETTHMSIEIFTESFAASYIVHKALNFIE